MAEGIFLEQNGELVDMQQAAYVSEDVLQSLLERHGVLLAGDQMAPGLESRRFLLIKREAGIPAGINERDRWSIDHVFIDQDAVPTLVEVKRSQNTQIRREVVGQMFDYAANAVAHWPEGTLATQFVATHTADEGGAIETLRAFLNLTNGGIEDAQEHIEAWWRQAEANLRSGRLRLLFVADHIPPELRRIIEFLNQQMATTEVLGIEIRNYEGPGFRALVPRVVGLTEAARDRKERQTGPQIPISEIWEAAAPAVREARALLDSWASETGIEATDLAKSRRYRVGRGTLAYLYPGDEYRSVYFRIGAVGTPADSEGLRALLSEIRGGAVVAPKEPGVSCEFIVRAWSELESRFLPALLAAAAGPT
jgi:hypothetical protein